MRRPAQRAEGRGLGEMGRWKNTCCTISFFLPLDLVRASRFGD
jgi:hypothetical protein